MSLDDVEEFMSAAVAEEVKQVFRRSSGGAIPDVRGRKKDEEEESASKLSQYARTSQGFSPTSSTVTTLPPDCYTIGLTMAGEVVFHPQKLVTDNLMRLPDSRSDEVVAEVEKFWSLKGLFSDYGFAHKRGFLLFGPPGSGKTSTVALITNDMIKRGGLVILADHPGVLAKGLGQLRAIEPERPVVVIMEDLDTIIYNYGESQVLSVLDGESQIENVVYIATTNYPENLDGRITNRPSRFDRIVKIGLPNKEARRIFLESKIKDVVVEGIDLAEATDGLSIAHIKELIVSVFCQGNKVTETLERLKKMKVTPKSGGDGGPLGLG